VLTQLKKLLGWYPLYVGLQKGIGADKLRYRCLEELALKPGDVVLDVGCGPAYYFDRLPKPLVYHGFDTDPNYIAHARKRFGAYGTFHHEIFDEIHLPQLPPVDAVLLLGLLHHLSDDQCRALLANAAKALGPDGRVIAVDTVRHPGQGRISRWMSDNDRGEYVRDPAGFTALGKEFFADVDGEVVDDLTRVPASYWIMRMRTPV
jgi:cyclopropane fatty-acyl-phospholipid synthase-like methyltransferase